MPRPEKVQAVEEIKERIENAEATFLTEYRGLSVSEQQQLRRGLREANAEYKVVKMSLARRAASELGLDEGLAESMVGPTAIAFANADPVPVAKVLKDFAKEHEHLVLKVGLMSGKLLPPEQVSKLADIEPRDVLLSKIAGAAKAPLGKLAGMLGSFTRDTASMMSQLLEKKEGGEFVPAGAAEEVEPEPVKAPAEPEGEAPAEDETAEVEAEEPPADAEDASAEAEAEEPVAEADEPAAETEETPKAEADEADAEGESDDSESDSEEDSPADEAEEE